jgi:hypothetical protein
MFSDQHLTPEYHAETFLYDHASLVLCPHCRMHVCIVEESLALLNRLPALIEIPTFLLCEFVIFFLADIEGIVTL